MKVEHKAEGSKGMFYHEKDGKILAQMTYSMAGETRMIIDHTHVDEALKGQSAGMQLLNKAVDFARENSLEVLPLCPFAAAIFKKKPEIQDVLRK
ncbi:N-acetyltransferase [Crocinitomicaceae bacterium]|nr:N-acetyltransferase [Crocinitomicaceae bacterium]MDB3906116.1 N-acetyltransferase [Crocinitomicaceae bacterium]